MVIVAGVSGSPAQTLNCDSRGGFVKSASGEGEAEDIAHKAEDRWENAKQRSFRDYA